MEVLAGAVVSLEGSAGKGFDSDLTYVVGEGLHRVSTLGGEPQGHLRITLPQPLCSKVTTKFPLVCLV